MGTKGRPFYRIVVMKSTAGRDGAFIDLIGTSNPTAAKDRVQIDEAKALKWLLSGAQPTETVAYMLHKAGVLDKFFEQRPAAKAKFKTIDKTTAAISRATVIEQAKAEAKAEAKPEPVAEVAAEPVAETPAEPAATE